jgi:hypothetical protein
LRQAKVRASEEEEEEAHHGHHHHGEDRRHHHGEGHHHHHGEDRRHFEGDHLWRAATPAEVKDLAARVGNHVDVERLAATLASLEKLAGRLPEGIQEPGRLADMKNLLDSLRADLSKAVPDEDKTKAAAVPEADKTEAVAVRKADETKAVAVPEAEGQAVRYPGLQIHLLPVDD